MDAQRDGSRCGIASALAGLGAHHPELVSHLAQDGHDPLRRATGDARCACACAYNERATQNMRVCISMSSCSAPHPAERACAIRSCLLNTGLLRGMLQNDVFEVSARVRHREWRSCASRSKTHRRIM